MSKLTITEELMTKDVTLEKYIDVNIYDLFKTFSNAERLQIVQELMQEVQEEVDIHKSG